MKINERKIERECPICHKTYTEPPATSREDNETKICPDCGIRQALKSIGINEDEREKIIAIIHRQKV